MNESLGLYVHGIGEDRPIPPGIDPSTLSIARVYDYVMSGRDHYESDRRAAKNMIDVLPETPLMARGQPALPAPGSPLPGRRRRCPTDHRHRVGAANGGTCTRSRTT